MAGATGSGFAYSKLHNPRAAAIAGGFAAAYFMAGRLLVTGNSKGGYDLGTGAVPLGGWAPARGGAWVGAD